MAAEAARLAGLVHHLDTGDLDFEHQLDGLFDVGLGGVAADAEGVLVVVLHRQRRFFRHMRGDEHAHELLAVHCRRSSSIFTEPTVIRTLSWRARDNGFKAETSMTSTCGRL